MGEKGNAYLDQTRVLRLDDLAVWILECYLAHQVLVVNAFRDIAILALVV